MTAPYNQLPIPEEDMISVGRSIGDSLAGNTDPHMPVPRADWVKLTADEEMVLAIFREHPGQCLTSERLLELAGAAHDAGAQTSGVAERRALTAAGIERVVRSLDRKLSMAQRGERIRVMSGVGYILRR